MTTVRRWDPVLLAGDWGARIAVEESLPRDPLATNAALPPIQVVIPCVAKDAATLPLAVASVSLGSSNPVARVVVLAPRADHAALAATVGDAVHLVADDEFHLPRAAAAIIAQVPDDRRGWVWQQVLKLAAVAYSEASAVLVLDADTVLLEMRVWFDGSRQVLPVAHEYHLPYEHHAERCLGGSRRREGLSWVTHHQLMQPAVVRSMLRLVAMRSHVGVDGGRGDIDVALAAWVRQGDFTEDSALSEYHTYGCYLRHRHPRGAVLARWANVAVPRRALAPTVEEIRDQCPGAMSVSAHAFLQ